MPKFICKNSECLFFNKEVIEGTATYKVVGDKVMCREAYCPSCNLIREEIVENKVFEVPTYEAVGINSNRRSWSKNTKEGLTYY